MNWKNILVAWTFLFIGVGVFALLGVRYADDVLFYLTAEKKSVRINAVHGVVTRVSDPAHAYESYDTEIAVSIKTPGGEKTFYEHLSGSKRDIDKRIAELQGMLHSETWVFLSDRTPDHFATTLVFPTARLYALLIPLLILILPSIFVLYKYYSTKRDA